MSNSSLIYCCPVPGLDQYWQFIHPDGQLFHDCRTNIFTFRKDSEFRLISLKDNILKPDSSFTLEINEPIITLAYSRNKKFVAIQTPSTPIRVINIDNRHELKLRVKNSDKNASLITFDWLWNQTSSIDFYIVETSAIHLYKVDEKKEKMKRLASFALETSFTWFDTKTEILLLGNKSGLVQTIFFSDYSKTKKVKGPSFLLDLRSKSLTKKQYEELNKSSNLATDSYLKWNTGNMFVYPSFRNRDILFPDPSECNPNNHKHKTLFVNIFIVKRYGIPTFMHLNVDYGSIFIFSIGAARVDIYQGSLTVSPKSIYTLSLVDNLIVVNNASERKSYVFDIKKSNPSEPLSKPQTILKLNTKLTSKPSFMFLSHNLDMTRSKSAPEIPEEDKGKHEYHNVYEGQSLDQENKLVKEIILTIERENSEVYKTPEKPKEKRKKSKEVDTPQYNNVDMSPLPDRDSPSGRLKAPFILVDSKYIDDIKAKDSAESHTSMSTSELEPRKWTNECLEEILLFKNEIVEETLYWNSTRLLDYSYLVDTKNRALLKFEIDFKIVPTIFKDHINTFFFFIRRGNCKDLAIDFLRRMLLHKEELMNVSFIFHKLLDIYRKVQDKRQLSKDPATFSSPTKGISSDATKDFLLEESMLSSKVLSPQQQVDLNTYSPYNVILQTDLYVQIFHPLSEHPSFDQEYFICVLLEYFRASDENNLPILDGIQAIFFKALILKKKFHMLCHLLQFHCLDDSLELAEVLIKLGMKDKSKFEGSSSNPLIKYIDEDYFSEALQLGLDMLHRLKKVRKIVKYLMALDKFSEAMEIALDNDFEGIDPQVFLDAAKGHGNPKLEEDVKNFFLKNLKKAKGDDYDPAIVGLAQSFKNGFKSPNKT